MQCHRIDDFSQNICERKQAHFHKEKRVDKPNRCTNDISTKYYSRLKM